MNRKSQLRLAPDPRNAISWNVKMPPEAGVWSCSPLVHIEFDGSMGVLEVDWRGRGGYDVFFLAVTILPIVGAETHHSWSAETAMKNGAEPAGKTCQASLVSRTLCKPPNIRTGHQHEIGRTRGHTDTRVFFLSLHWSLGILDGVEVRRGTAWRYRTRAKAKDTKVWV